MTSLRQLALDAHTARLAAQPRRDQRGLPQETSYLFAEFVLKQPEPDDVWEPVEIDWNYVELADGIRLWRDFERSQWLYYCSDGTFYPVGCLADLGEALTISNEYTSAVEERAAYLAAQWQRIHAAINKADNDHRVYIDTWSHNNGNGIWDKLAESNS